jgi:hypothetical protein
MYYKALYCRYSVFFEFLIFNRIHQYSDQKIVRVYCYTTYFRISILFSLSFFNCTIRTKCARLYQCFNLIIVSSTLFEHASVHPLKDLYMQFYGIAFKHILSATRLLIWMHERNIIKLHVQILLRMNTLMLEICRRYYNLIKTLT